LQRRCSSHHAEKNCSIGAHPTMQLSLTATACTLLYAASVCGHELVGAIGLDASSIPKVDLSQDRGKVIGALHHAISSKGPGFFYLTNHGIHKSVFYNAVKEAHKFYSLPPNKKQVISAIGYGGGTSSTKGYVPPDFEGLYAKDASDVRPEKEKASMKRNKREALVFRYPEEHEVKNEEYFADYHGFLAKLDMNHDLVVTMSSQNDSSSNMPTDHGTHNAAMNCGHQANRVAPVKDLGAAARRFFQKNQWPSSEDVPGFHAAAQKYFSEMKKVAHKMFGLFSECLSHMPETCYNETITTMKRCPRHLKDPALKSLVSDKGMTTFNLVHYPPYVDDDDSFGIVDHTDWEAFTLLYPLYLHEINVDALTNETFPSSDNPNLDPQSSIAFTGLEVWHENKWMAVPRMPGAIIVNQGEMLSRLSNGCFKAPVHRVRAKSDFHRYSLISFWAPDFNVLLPDPHLPCGKVPVGEHYLKRNGLV